MQYLSALMMPDDGLFKIHLQLYRKQRSAKESVVSLLLGVKYLLKEPADAFQKCNQWIKWCCQLSLKPSERFLNLRWNELEARQRFSCCILRKQTQSLKKWKWTGRLHASACSPAIREKCRRTCFQTNIIELVLQHTSQHFNCVSVWNK